jgi:hypothetical protein
VRAKLLASDVPILGPDRLDPLRKSLHEFLQEFSGAIADELAMFIEELPTCPT